MKRCIHQLLLLSLFLGILSACQIEGGVRDRTPVVPAVVDTPQPLLAPTNEAVAEALAERSDVWALGITDLPNDLFPYPADSALRRINSVALEMLYPSPILAYNYDFQSTGVLTKVPSIANGDVQINTVSVFLDAAGNITTTTTSVITEVQQLSITYRWNPDLTWSDGTPLTAADSVFAYDLARRQAPLGEEARLLLDRTANYEQIDDYTTRAVLQPDLIGSSFLLSYWTPLPKHLLQDVDPLEIRNGVLSTQPVGYGPYTVESRTSNEIRFVRNPHYFGTIPESSHVVLTSMSGIDMIRANLQNGNLDVAVTDRVAVDQYAFIDQDARAGLPVSYYRSPVWEHIDFNLDVFTLQDIRIRRAIAYGFNRQALADTLFNGRSPALNSWILPEQRGATNNDQLTLYPFDPDTANALLDEAGYGMTESGIRASSQGITLTFQLITTTGSTLRQEIAERFKSDMQNIGVDIQIQYLSPEEIFAPNGPLFLRQFELALFAWIATPDPAGLQLWSCAAVPSEANGWVGNNFAGWCMRDADYAVKLAATSLDRNEQFNQYLVQQQLFTSELPSLPLFQRLGVAIAVDTIEGIKPDALAPITWNIADWKRVPANN
jgi:peptide/nickel transport system substrate-binding protein